MASFSSFIFKSQKSKSIFFCLFVCFLFVFFAADSIFCALAKYQNEFSRRSGFKAISKAQSIISTLYLSKAHMNWGGYWSWWKRTQKICVRSRKKRCLPGTSNSHNPRLTWTSAQSEETLKVRGDASTYINHERSHQDRLKKKKKWKPPAPMSTSQSCVSISFCASVTLFFSSRFFCYPLSWFMCFASVFCCLSDRFESLLFATVSILSFFFYRLSLCGCSSALTILRVIFHLARRGLPSNGPQHYFFYIYKIV